MTQHALPADHSPQGTAAADAPARQLRVPHRWLRRLGAAVVLLLVMYLTRSWYLPLVGTCLDVSSPPHRADYVVVLGGGVENRPFAAAALVELGWADAVLIPEISPPPEVTEQILPPEHVVTREILIKQGVPPEHIHLMRGEHGSTFDEAMSLRAVLEKEPDARAMVVTDNVHTRRARWVMWQVMGETAERVRFVATPEEGFRLDRWWKTPDGFFYVPSEHLKLLFYLFRYGNGFAWLVGLVVVAAIPAVAIISWRHRRSRPAVPSDA